MLASSSSSIPSTIGVFNSLSVIGDFLQLLAVLFHKLFSFIFLAKYTVSLTIGTVGTAVDLQLHSLEHRVNCLCRPISVRCINNTNASLSLFSDLEFHFYGCFCYRMVVFLRVSSSQTFLQGFIELITQKQITIY